MIYRPLLCMRSHYPNKNLANDCCTFTILEPFAECLLQKHPPPYNQNFQFLTHLKNAIVQKSNMDKSV